MGMNLLKNTTSQADHQSPRAVFQSITENLNKVLSGVKLKRRAARKARLKVIRMQADRAEGLLPPVSSDMRTMRGDTEGALYKAFSNGHLDGIDIQAEEMRLAIRKMRDLLPSANAVEAEAEAKVRAAEAEAARVAVSGTLASRIGEEEQKLRKLEEERTHYERLANEIAAGQRPKLWEPYTGPMPEMEQPIVYTLRDFPADGIHSEREREQAAIDWTRRDRERKEHEWREKCRATRLGISIDDLHLLEEDDSKEVEVA